ncbi:PREDICTED: uncharacterized protein LOC106818189 [Priapulus caudatus]|uniref:Uncharacterized protein LOC106818189 n=1 Tax=Priapulus caudatus TaxID=37621 RepID=A0ABM1F1T1_PRICU|nr:PREDICTED: uncharacterized protein LOC106818189 [Priapulus caudatus]
MKCLLVALCLAASSYAYKLDLDIDLENAVWPKGAYGLTKPEFGCPEPEEGFTWREGMRFHDTEDSFPDNQWSDILHFYGNYGKNNMEQHFCMKTTDQTSDYAWPQGQYCLFRASNQACPAGFRDGWIKFDDEDSFNSNHVSGEVPHGTYDHNTLIWYCCKTQGFHDVPMQLPRHKPFYLFKHGDRCQQVAGMHENEEWFQWDSEDTPPGNEYAGSVPTSVIGQNVRIYYCYYTPKFRRPDSRQ